MTIYNYDREVHYTTSKEPLYTKVTIAGRWYHKLLLRLARLILKKFDSFETIKHVNYKTILIERNNLAHLIRDVAIRYEMATGFAPKTIILGREQQRELTRHVMESPESIQLTRDITNGWAPQYRGMRLYMHPFISGIIPMKEEIL